MHARRQLDHCRSTVWEDKREELAAERTKRWGKDARVCGHRAQRLEEEDETSGRGARGGRCIFICRRIKTCGGRTDSDTHTLAPLHSAIPGNNGDLRRSAPANPAPANTVSPCANETLLAERSFLHRNNTRPPSTRTNLRLTLSEFQLIPPACPSRAIPVDGCLFEPHLTPLTVRRSVQQRTSRTSAIFPPSFPRLLEVMRAARPILGFHLSTKT